VSSDVDLSSRTRLGPGASKHFVGETLFARIGRTVCAADCLPRKELFESWELARRARRRFRGGRVVDLACGHGLVAHLMLLLDDTSPFALAADVRLPNSAPRLAAAMVGAWPRLAGRVALEERAIEDVALEAGDLVVSSHACGALTDAVLDRAIAASARVVVLPCCHDTGRNDTGRLEGWIDAALAIDVTRAAKLRAAGYAVTTQRIPEAITPKNRLLLGEPPRPTARTSAPSRTRR
jgi:SAM-dependent methyltransferase